jgi:hypothetical protein
MSLSLGSGPGLQLGHWVARVSRPAAGEHCGPAVFEVMGACNMKVSGSMRRVALAIYSWYSTRVACMMYLVRFSSRQIMILRPRDYNGVRMSP